MMKKQFSFALFCLLSLRFFGQGPAAAEPNYIPVIAYWSVNDTFEYTVIKGKKKFEKGVLKDSTATQTAMTFVVTDSTEKSYTIRVFQENKLDEMLADGKLKGKDVEDMLKILDFQYLEYTTDEKGAFESYKNADKLYQSYKLMMERVLDRQLEKKEGKEKEKQALIAKFTSRPFFDAIFLQEVQVMHKFHGLSYAQDSVWYFDLESENPFKPGEKLNIPNELLTTVPEDWGGLVRLENLVSVEGDVALAFISGLLDSLTKAERDALFKENPPKYEVYISYAIDPDDGTVFSLFQKTTTYMGDQKVSEQFVEMFPPDEE